MISEDHLERGKSHDEQAVRAVPPGVDRSNWIWNASPRSARYKHNIHQSSYRTRLPPPNYTEHVDQVDLQT